MQGGGIPEASGSPIVNAQTPEQRLQNAIERLYQAFSRYDTYSGQACPCCVDHEDHERLRSKPLRELTLEDLADYSSKALLTWGTVDDFKHFLPRMYELLAHHPNSWLVLPEAIVGKLSLAKWRNWEPNEQSAVEEFLYAWWEHTLSTLPEYPKTIDTDEFLRSIEPVIEIHPFLEIWRRTESPTAVYRLAELLYENFQCRLSRRLRILDEQNDVFIQWLLEAETLAYLERAFDRYYANDPLPDHEFVDLLAYAIDRLIWLRTR
ncbi:MAG: hypothetical protein KatS3mg019_0316 [Fimbriimonadales bacterium]|nr:MAG: hypothetical protein KatS3mg019_0316 [Fimbriimonadales bacterium]